MIMTYEYKHGGIMEGEPEVEGTKSRTEGPMGKSPYTDLHSMV